MIKSKILDEFYLQKVKEINLIKTRQVAKTT